MTNFIVSSLKFTWNMSLFPMSILEVTTQETYNEGGKIKKATYIETQGKLKNEKETQACPPSYLLALEDQTEESFSLGPS